MKALFSIVVVGVLALLLVSACSGQPPGQEPIEEKLENRGYVMGAQVRRVNDFLVNSWNRVDRRNVIIYVGASRLYLISTRNPCDGLQETENLNYSTTTGNLTDKDKLLVRRHSGHVESCFIDTIYEIEKVNG